MSACSTTCGRGLRTVTRPITGCHVTEEYKQEYCNDEEMQRCPVNCLLGQWTGWTECSLVCQGPGVQLRLRPVLQTPFNYGGVAKCEEDDGTPVDVTNNDAIHQLRPGCNVGVPCPVDCVQSSWGEWGRCTVSCGGGVQARTKMTVQEPLHGGKSCDVALQSRECEPLPCGVDCVAAEWQEWSGCDASCNGVRERHRTGDNCIDEELREEDPCNKDVNCVQSATGAVVSWTPIVLGAGIGALVLAAAAAGAYFYFKPKEGGEVDDLDDMEPEISEGMEDETLQSASSGPMRQLDYVDVDPDSSFWQSK